MTKTLLHIGAGRLDLPALRQAREAGLSVIAVDADPEAPGRQEADAFHVVPEDDPRQVVARLEASAADTHWVGAHTLRPGALELVAAFEEARLARDPQARRIGPDPTGPSSPTGAPPERDPGELREGTLEVNAFLRDGDFVPAGVASLEGSEAGELLALLPAPIDASQAARAMTITEQAARARGIVHGPVVARLAPRADGELELLALRPCFSAVVATVLAPLALGKSPLQAWFASLAEAGGPFDAMPPYTLGDRGGPRNEAGEELDALPPLAAACVVDAERLHPGPRSLTHATGDAPDGTRVLWLPAGCPAHLSETAPAPARWLFSVRAEDPEDARARLARARSVHGDAARSAPAAGLERVVG